MVVLVACLAIMARDEANVITDSKADSGPSLLLAQAGQTRRKPDRTSLHKAVECRASVGRATDRLSSPPQNKGLVGTNYLVTLAYQQTFVKQLEFPSRPVYLLSAVRAGWQDGDGSRTPNGSEGRIATIANAGSDARSAVPCPIEPYNLTQWFHCVKSNCGMIKR